MWEYRPLKYKEGIILKFERKKKTERRKPGE